MVRRWFYGTSIVTLVLLAISAVVAPVALWLIVVAGPLMIVGFYDALQRRHTVLRNFPLIGHGRYVIEALRPEAHQYFIESNIDAFPIEREFREIVYQRAKGELETKPFGTQRDVYRSGYEWVPHSLAPVTPLPEAPRVVIGGAECAHPYAASLLNISAMSYGALSKNAVLALNEGAKAGRFAHNTGEGGVSPYHLEPEGDLIWQIGTGYFGCRDEAGYFDPVRYAEQAAHTSVRMVELKLSQGAKPAHGGILPGCKVSKEIATIRGVQPGETVISPPAHRTFSTPIGLLEFVARLRELARGKPVGFKLCVGRRVDFLAVCKAMLETGLHPDFITVDGGEGGTGAAPLEFANSVGMPARDGWMFVNNALIGTGLRQRVRVIATGKILTGFHMVRAFALGADLCASARGMMLALGCIQALRCNTNACPTGITTQNAALVHGLNVAHKATRVARYHAATLNAFLECLGAMGLGDPRALRPHHILRRAQDLKVHSLGDLHDRLEDRQLVEGGEMLPGWRDHWQEARADRW